MAQNLVVQLHETEQTLEWLEKALLDGLHSVVNVSSGAIAEAEESTYACNQHPCVWKRGSLPEAARRTIHDAPKVTPQCEQDALPVRPQRPMSLLHWFGATGAQTHRNIGIANRAHNHVYSLLFPYSPCSSTSRPLLLFLTVIGAGTQIRAEVDYTGHWPAGGCQSSVLFPSGSMTQANFPYSDSLILSRTVQPSSRRTFTKACRSSTR